MENHSQEGQPNGYKNLFSTLVTILCCVVLVVLACHGYVSMFLFRNRFNSQRLWTFSLFMDG